MAVKKPNAAELLMAAVAEFTARQESLYSKSEIERQGTKIILPAHPKPMTYDEGISALKKAKQDEETIVSVDETIQRYPSEGAIAFAKALDKVFGFTQQVAIPGFFGDTPPKFISIPTGYGETTQAPWGRIVIPGIPGYLETTYSLQGKRVCFRVTGEVMKKYKQAFFDVIAETRRVADAESIYKGKAWQVTFPDPTKPGFDPFLSAPQPMDLRGVREDELVFSDSVMEQVNMGIFTPLRQIAACRKLGVPLKRGVLLAGAYGTGKTLTARVAAKIAAENNVSFFHLKYVTDLPRCIEVARDYQPAMIFAEDIDRVMGGQERNDEIDLILNTIDGIDSKRSELMVVLTTNDMAKINAAMQREGRLDMTINMLPPDAPAVDRLLRMYGRGLIPATEDLTVVCDMLAGQIPAAIREVVERAKLAQLSTYSTALGMDYSYDHITATALRIAAQSLLDQKELWAKHSKTEPSLVERAFGRMGHAIVEGVLAEAAGYVEGDVMEYIVKEAPASIGRTIADKVAERLAADSQTVLDR